MSIRVQITINPKLPPSVNESYQPFGFYKLGVCCWNYEGYDGAIEWINTLFFCTEAKYVNPTSLRVWLVPGVTGFAIPRIATTNAIADFVINGIARNPVTGLGMPLGL